jgi:hypothetical protein
LISVIWFAMKTLECAAGRRPSRRSQNNGYNVGLAKTEHRVPVPLVV